MPQGGRNSGRVVATDEQGRQRPALGDAAQHVERRRIGPMQILERQHHRLNARARHHPVGQRRQLPAPQFLRRQSRRAFRRQRNVEQRREQGRILRWVELDLRERTLQLREAPLGGHVGAAEALAAPFGDRMQRRVLQKLRAAPFDPGVRHFAQPRMKLLDQARLAEPRLANDLHQLAVALTRPLPAPHQHCDFLVAADQRREIARPRAASAAARPHQPEQSHRLGHAFEFMAAALLGDEQASDLALHPRRDHDRARLGERLHPRRDVGGVAEDLARRIHYHRTSFDADAGGERRLARAGVLAVQLGQRALDRQRRTRRTLSVVLLRHRISEQRHQPVAELLGDVAAHLRHRRRGGIEIRPDQVAPLLGIELRRNAGRIHQIAEHHREIAALTDSFDRNGDWGRHHSDGDRRRHDGRRRRCRRRCAAQFGDRLQQLLAMAERRDADVLEIVAGQPTQQVAVDVVGAENLGILGETDPTEPTVDVQVQSPWALVSGSF